MEELDNSPVKANEAYTAIVSKTDFLKKLTPPKAKAVERIFSPMMDKLDEFDERFNQVIAESKIRIDDKLIEKAKRLRLDMRPIRTTAEAERKREKSEYLVAGKAIDEASGQVKSAVAEKEEKLLAIEKHAENIEKQRIKDLQDQREEMLSKYIENSSLMNLGAMEQEIFDAFFAVKEKDFNDAIEAEKKAESDRLAKEKAEAEAIEAQRVANASLKAEANRLAKEKEKIKKRAEELSPYIVFIRDYKKLIESEDSDYSEMLALIKKGAILEWEQKQVEEERGIKVEARERKAKEELQAKLKAIQEENEKEKADKKEAERLLEEQAEAKAKLPLKTQLSEWANSFELPATQIENETTKDIRQKFQGFKKWAEREVNNI
jgi:colicin import membrane protein